MPQQRGKRHLFDPRDGDQAVRLLGIEAEQGAIEPPRTNCFSIYHVGAGRGAFCADTARYPFAANSLLFFTPYQYVQLEVQSPLKADLIQFHANFLCVETFHAETGCAGTLFNDLFRPPIVDLDRTSRREVAALLQRMRREQDDRPHAFQDMLLAHLKILLIVATRLRSSATADGAAEATGPRHPVLGQLKELIETHYHALHGPADYARLLHMSPKTLGRIVREQLGTSLTDLIRQRVLTHAKWQLLHTLKPVKEIAREVGFSDELYFSRMFKKATGFSPRFFREFETEIRGGSNLSMTSPPAPIRHRQPPADNPRS